MSKPTMTYERWIMEVSPLTGTDRQAAAERSTNPEESPGWPLRRNRFSEAAVSSAVQGRELIPAAELAEGLGVPVESLLAASVARRTVAGAVPPKVIASGIARLEYFFDRAEVRATYGHFRVGRSGCARKDSQDREGPALNQAP